jgi:glycosyltransferase 2 family protein
MDRKRLLVSAVVLAILATLIYMQFRTWKNFDWDLFLSQTHRVNLFHIFHGVALIYAGYVLRAIRWKIFLKPVRPEARSLELVSPTLVGFTGLALLGRPGEFIRPYLIARRTNLPVSSQFAVWAVERIFDIGAFTLLFVIVAFFATAPKRLAQYTTFREVGIVLLLIFGALTIGAIFVSRSGDAIARWVEQRFGSSKWGHVVAERVREFRSGLNTIHGTSELLQLIAVSVLMWAMIAIAYKEVTHSYGVEKLDIPQTQVLLLMASSMVGSLIQLPGVGGGSQLATIAMLNHVFDVPPELAASAGIMLWLVTFVAVIPVGLFLAHRERLSLRKLSEESHQNEGDSSSAELSS